MKLIKKNMPPVRFVKYCKKTNACFREMGKKDYEAKKALRTSLLGEQGYLCCYCGKRINNDDTTTIEHLASLDRGPKLQLNYDNLLASCNGGEKKRTSANKKDICNKTHPLYCNAHKKNKTIPITPLCPTCENRFLYDNEGNIFTDSKDLDAEETIRILNLDNAVLNNQRKAAIAVYTMFNFNSEEWEAEIERLDSLDNEGKYEPFCFASKFYIQTQKIDVL